ncbi:terminase [Nocardia cyriacigeorgica]|uniref:Terminase n=1 Tax=Nocardia cyriacigeorgica TaxID=135487 RepID=A0ABX0CL17_9NOCA|nr:terminase [Nocardia cyriacigeorgica]NEW40791.1 terminase [Nocardia cyriacigeorgica]NEW50983.1 terminase [Nocardia cyriacigeorgica]NEW54434.1 terminase [Nocardia cyriacigeorgica]
MQKLWLPSPPSGTPICVGFDGSENNDWTALRAETRDGLQFTPRYGPDRRPTIWNPAEWGGQIPRGEVHAAVDEVFSTFDVARMYFDPHDWRSEGGDWALRYGEEHVFEWATNRINQMYAAIRRFEIDLKTGRITHDGCPIAEIHMANCRKVPKPGDKYVLGKPSDHQKIDVSIASIIVHEAAADAREAGWEDVDGRMFCFS